MQLLSRFTLHSHRSDVRIKIVIIAYRSEMKLVRVHQRIRNCRTTVQDPPSIRRYSPNSITPTSGKSAIWNLGWRGRHGFVADLSPTSRGSRHSGIWTYNLSAANVKLWTRHGSRPIGADSLTVNVDSSWFAVCSTYCYVCIMHMHVLSWKYDVLSKIHLRQLMHIYLKSNIAKFHPK